MPSQLEIEAVLDSLANAPAMIVPLVREVPADRLKQRTAEGKWSVHEHACHLAEVHPLFFERLDVMTGRTEGVIETYEPPADQQQGSLLDKELDAELERFRRDRARLVERLRELEPSDWERTADHPQYSHYSVFILFRHVVMHDHLHAYRIEEILLE